MALGGNLFRLRTAPGEGTYHVLSFTIASGGVTAGDMVNVGDTYGVVVEDGTVGNTGVCVYKAERIMVPCAPASTALFTVGEKVYLDTATGLVTDTTTSNTVLIGIVTLASAVGDTQVEIDLDGTLHLVS